MIRKLLRLLLLAGLFAPVLKPVIAQKPVIAVFGSSVANGSGDTAGSGGYAGMIGRVLETRGYKVVNVSKGGDNVRKIMPRFATDLLPLHPDFVIIGLSLGNEGITAKSELNRARIVERFRSGMVHLIRLCRENGMQPVVVSCYTRNDFGPEQYAAIQQMNLLENTWDVPVINALGAIDDGAGHWAEGFWHDRSHPNAEGHREIFQAFVPTLFDAIRAGKRPPEKDRSGRFLTIPGQNAARPLSFSPGEPIRTFSAGFYIRTSHDGTIAAIKGGTQDTRIVMQQGRIGLRVNGRMIFMADTNSENNGWQHIVVSCRFAAGSTAFYVNGKLAGQTRLTLEMKEFILGGSGDPGTPSPAVAGFRDCLIYRSALNSNEVVAWYHDQLLPASLEVYAPLSDPEFIPGHEAENRAQSLSRLMIRETGLFSAEEMKVQEK